MIATLIGITLALVLFAMHRIGDLVPAVIFLGLAAFAVFVLPGFPASPVACLRTPTGCVTHAEMIRLVIAAFLVPVGAAVVYKMLRGDKPGRTGKRLP